MGNLLPFIKVAENTDAADKEELKQAYDSQATAARRYAKTKLFATATELRDDVFIEETMETMDAGAQLVILTWCPEDMRSFLRKYKTAALKWKNIPSFFGAVSIERQMNHTLAMAKTKYVPGLDGEGFRLLFKVMEELCVGYRKAGGKKEDDQLLIEIIAKCRGRKGAEDLYRNDRKDLTTSLQKGEATLHSARQVMMEAERREEAEAGASSDSDEEAKSAQVTSIKKTDKNKETLDRLAWLEAENKVLTALVTSSSYQGGRGGGGGGGGGGGQKWNGSDTGNSTGKKAVCFKFRDTGTCKFGDNCRFAH
jgi:hypothetical protein